MLWRSRWIGALLAASATLWGGRAAAADGRALGQPVVPPGQERALLGALSPLKLGAEVAGGYRLDGLGIDAGTVTIRLLGSAESGAPEELRLAVALRGSRDGTITHELTAAGQESELTESARAALAAVRQALERNATATFWDRVTVRVSAGLGRSGAIERELVIAPTSPPPWKQLAFGLLAVVLLGGFGGWWARRERSPVAPQVVAVVYGGVVLVVGFFGLQWLLLGAASVPADPADDAWMATLRGREESVVAATLLLASLALVAAAIEGALRWSRARRRPVGPRTLIQNAPVALHTWLGRARPSGALRRAPVKERWKSPASVCLDVGLVVALSCLVRFVLTTGNVLTDGGSGYWRVLTYSNGFGGLAVLLQSGLPAPVGEQMWPTVGALTALAAAAPPLVYGLARLLDLERSAAFVAGIALAAYPLHAALYASDFLAGPLLSLQLLGLVLVLVGYRATSGASSFAGLTLLAFTLWIRPDAAVIGVPLAVIALTRWSRTRWLTPAVTIGAGWLLAMVVVRWQVLGAGGLTPGADPTWPLTEAPWLEYLGEIAILPPWLLVGVPVGLVLLPRRVALVVVAALVAGLVPAHLHRAFDPARSHLELFRYATATLPWLCLAVGAAVVGIAGLTPSQRWRPRVLVVLVVAIAATPLLVLDYLSVEYAPRAEERVFRSALEQVPEGCLVVVPDEPTGSVEQVAERFAFIAAEAWLAGESKVRSEQVVGAARFLAALQRGGELPAASKVVPGADVVPGAIDGARSCWVYFRGTHCAYGLYGEPAEPCRELEARVSLEPLASWRISYVSHRLVTRPGISGPPWRDPALELKLARIAGQR